MADEFHHTTGICSGSNWWDSSRNAMSMTLPCSTAINEMHGGGSFGWETADQMAVEATAAIRSSINCDDSAASVSGSSSVVLQDAPKPQGSDSVSGGGGGNILMDSTLQMMGYGLSSSTSMDWSQALLSRNSTTTTTTTGRCAGNNSFHSMFQEGVVESPVQVQRDHWSLNNCSNTGVAVSSSSTDSSFKPTNHQGFALDQHYRSSSSESSVTCQGYPTSFSLDSSVSYGCPNSSTLFQGLLESDLQAQQSPYGAILSPSLNYGMIMNDLPSPTWRPRFPHFLKTSSPQKQQQQQQILNNQLHFSNNTPYWNAAAAASAAPPPPNSNIRSSFYPSSQAPLLAPTCFEGKPTTCNSNLNLKPKPEEVRDSGSVMKKGSSEPATKKPRVDTPSPLPTFKVRKEKLGDRITALQQLVSPFGKTDTASVLFEAIEYIKFLHDQVSALSAPYMKNAAIQQPQHQSSEKSKESERPERDLRSRGLCLVPISSTFPVTNETTADFWTPTFGGTFR